MQGHLAGILFSQYFLYGTGMDFQVLSFITGSYFSLFNWDVDFFANHTQDRVPIKFYNMQWDLEF